MMIWQSSGLQDSIYRRYQQFKKGKFMRTTSTQSLALASVSAILLLTACATPYEPAKEPGGMGYYSEKLEGNKFKLVYGGRDGNTKDREVVDLWLKRAAELCEGKNFTHTREITYKTWQSYNPAIYSFVTYRLPTVTGVVTCE